MVTQPLDTTTDLLVGTEYSLTLEAWDTPQAISMTPGPGKAPPGMAVIDDWGRPTGIDGTPTTEGAWVITVSAIDGPGPVTLTVRPAGWEPPEPTEVTAAPPVFDDEALTVTITEVPGVLYSVDGIPTAPGVHDAVPDSEVTVTAYPASEDYVLTGDAAWTHRFTADESEDYPEDDPRYVDYITRTGGAVSAMLGQPDRPGQQDLAEHCAEVLTGYVRGFVRSLPGVAGRGFTSYGVPHRDIRAVIITATVRLASNPRQLTYYQSGDYSERPAVMAGWTIAELTVLRRYRRVSA